MKLVLAVAGTDRHILHNVVVSNLTTDLDFLYHTHAGVFDLSVILLNAEVGPALYWKIFRL